MFQLISLVPISLCPSLLHGRAVPGGHNHSFVPPIYQRGSVNCYTVQYSTFFLSSNMGPLRRPVTKHFGLARQIPDVLTRVTFDFRASSSTKRLTLFHCSFFFLPVIASCPARLPRLTICPTVAAATSDNDVLLPSLYPCLHLGLLCAVRPRVSLFVPQIPSPLGLIRLSSRSTL